MRRRTPAVRAALLCTHGAWTLEDLERALHRGDIGQRTYDRCLFFHTWAVPRLAGEAGSAQARAAARLGRAGLDRRIHRVRALLYRLAAEARE